MRYVGTSILIGMALTFCIAVSSASEAKADCGTDARNLDAKASQQQRTAGYEGAMPYLLAAAAKYEQCRSAETVGSHAWISNTILEGVDADALQTDFFDAGDKLKSGAWAKKTDWLIYSLCQFRSSFDVPQEHAAMLDEMHSPPTMSATGAVESKTCLPSLSDAFKKERAEHYSPPPPTPSPTIRPLTPDERAVVMGMIASSFVEKTPVQVETVSVADDYAMTQFSSKDTTGFALFRKEQGTWVVIRRQEAELSDEGHGAKMGLVFMSYDGIPDAVRKKLLANTTIVPPQQ
jgi:hypothetical protein